MDKCSGTGQIRRFCALPFRRKLRAVRTIGQLWRDGDGRGPHEARLSRRARRPLGGGLVGRGRPRGRGARQRPAGAGRAQGRRLRDPRPDEPRVGALRLRAGARRRRRGGDLREQLAEGLPLRARALGRGRRAGRGRGAAGEDRGRRRSRHVLTFADLDELRARGREFAAANPDALAEAEAQIGEEDLFTFIYTSGTTGPPKACMIRHRNYYEMATCIDDVPEFALRRRRDAALPAAGAQLRAADAPARRAQGLHDRLLPGPAARRRGDAGGAADAAAERAAALREGAHGRARAVRAGARAAKAAARLGARGRAAR